MKGTPEHESTTDKAVHRRPTLHVGDVLTAMTGRLVRTGLRPALEHEHPRLSPRLQFEVFDQDTSAWLRDASAHSDA